MAAGGTPGNVHLGAGRFWVAPVGTTEPTDASSALPSAWRPIGYTEDGTTVTIEITTEEIEVAEEYDPIDEVNTKRTTMLKIQMAEATRRNLALIVSGVADAANDATAYEFPDPGDEVKFMGVWDSEETAAGNDENKRWLFRECKPTGSIETQRNKAPNKALLPIEIKCVKPVGASPVKVFPNASGQI